MKKISRFLLFFTVTILCAVSLCVSAYADETAPSALYFETSEITLGSGETFADTLLYDNGAAPENITYSSSDYSVAYTDINGAVIAVNSGSAVITASDLNGLSASVSVTVLSAPKTLGINADELILGVGESFTLKPVFYNDEYARGAEYVSSDENIVSADENGNITALSKGNATVRIKLYNGVSAKCSIEVKSAPEKIKILNTDGSIVKGWGKYSVKYEIKGGASHSVKFTSSNPDVAEVSRKGIVIPKKYGKTTISIG